MYLGKHWTPCDIFQIWILSFSIIWWKKKRKGQRQQLVVGLGSSSRKYNYRQTDNNPDGKIVTTWPHFSNNSQFWGYFYSTRHFFMKYIFYVLFLMLLGFVFVANFLLKISLTIAQKWTTYRDYRRWVFELYSSSPFYKQQDTQGRRRYIRSSWRKRRMQIGLR